MGQFPHLTDDDPVKQPAPFLPTGDRVDLTELTSEVTQPVHFQARIQITGLTSNPGLSLLFHSGNDYLASHSKYKQTHKKISKAWNHSLW